jgi:hypothetical protein
MKIIYFLKQSKQSYLIISILGIFLSIFISYQMRWLGDDIFIGLRYVKNFNEGNGLVNNIGERVEGYTDFLWLMLISFFFRLKFDPGITAEVLGVVFSAGTLIIFSVIGYKISAAKNKFVFPFITLALAFNYDYNVWATSGLEVSFVTFLLSSAFYIYFFTGSTLNKRLFFAGFFICLGLLTRPDVMLILLFLNLLLVIKNLISKTNFIDLIKTHFLFNPSVIIIYIPYFLWRYNYYGFIFPNTYYNKLGYEDAFAQGFFYIWMYFKCHFTSFLIFIPFISLYPLIRKYGVKEFILKKEYSPLLTALSLILGYLIFFVAKVGGDFMYARFMIPCVPFIYFTIFYSLFLIDLKHLNTILFVILSFTLVETSIRTDMFFEPDGKGGKTLLIPEGIADERYCYLYCLNTDREVKQGIELNERLKNVNYKALIFGAQARFAYYADFSYCQDYFGLTDTLIAHSEIKERGRIGHEKHGTIDYFESKNINFSFNADPLKEDNYRLAQIDLPSGPVSMEIITYDNLIIEKFVHNLGKDFHYINFPNYLDSYITHTLPTIKSYDQLNIKYQKFYVYYFKNNNDKQRESLFTDKLKELKAQS